MRRIAEWGISILIAIGIAIIGLGMFVLFGLLMEHFGVIAIVVFCGLLAIWAIAAIVKEHLFPGSNAQDDDDLIV